MRRLPLPRRWITPASRLATRSDSGSDSSTRCAWPDRPLRSPPSVAPFGCPLRLPPRRPLPTRPRDAGSHAGVLTRGFSFCRWPTPASCCCSSERPRKRTRRTRRRRARGTQTPSVTRTRIPPCKFRRCCLVRESGSSPAAGRRCHLTTAATVPTTPCLRITLRAAAHHATLPARPAPVSHCLPLPTRQDLVGRFLRGGKEQLRLLPQARAPPPHGSKSCYSWSARHGELVP